MLQIFFYFLQVLIAYIVADFLSGIYHYLTDKGYNPVKSQVILFQEHHDDPQNFGIDIKPMLFGLPVGLIALFGWFPVFWIALGIFTSATQIFHYYGHNEGPWFVQMLQKANLILSEEAHDLHHRPEENYSTHYCIVSGWNNWWFNWVTKRIDKIMERK